MGYDFISCAPKPAEMLPEDVAFCKSNYEKSGGRFIQTDDPYEYIDQVDFLFTDAWWYHGSDNLKDKKIDEFYPKDQINQQLIDAAPEWMKVMHPLPIARAGGEPLPYPEGPAGRLHVPAHASAQGGAGPDVPSAGGGAADRDGGQGRGHPLRGVDVGV